jgi:hypothetical protein
VVSRLKRIDVAVDADGDPISSCVVVPADGDEMRRTGKLPLKGAVKIGLRALEEAIAAEGENIASIGIPEGTRSVTVSQWRLRAYGLGISKSTHDRARQTAFKRCSEALISSGHVTKNEDRVRVTNPCPP